MTSTQTAMRIGAHIAAPQVSRAVGRRWSARRTMENWLTWLYRAPAAGVCVIDGRDLAGHCTRIRRQSIECLAAVANRNDQGIVLLIDHRAPGAIEELRSVQGRFPELFQLGRIVVGVEHLPQDESRDLYIYRRASLAPVFAVTLGRSEEVQMLAAALTLTRAVASTYRGLFTGEIAAANVVESTRDAGGPHHPQTSANMVDFSQPSQR